MMDSSSSNATRPAPSLSVFVLTKNEEANIALCLASLKGCCDDIYVVDSFSTDSTVNIARSFDATVVEHCFEGHTKQRAWALKNLPFRHEWVLALDADHRLTPELREELRELFVSPPSDMYGMYIKRRQIFRGKWIRHGGYYPKYMLKIVRHKYAFLDDDEFDYRFYVNGPIKCLKNDILEDNRNELDIHFFIEKHNKFATELAREERLRLSGRLQYKVTPKFFGTPDQRTLWLKVQWCKLPLLARPFMMFFYRYFVRLGFLDGKEGLVFYFMQTLWFRFLVDIKRAEMEKEGVVQSSLQ